MQPRKLRILCLHSFRTSGAIFKQQVTRSGFGGTIEDLVELEFINAPHEASGPAPADVAPHFEPPYFQWWNAQTHTGTAGNAKVYGGWQASIMRLQQAMIEQGPFDGVMGFSQGGALAACAAALQETTQVPPVEVPPLKFVVVIAGFPPQDPQLAALFSRPLSLPSAHIIGERDIQKRASGLLLNNFQVHTDIWHQQGHVVPRLPSEQVDTLRSFLMQFSAAPPRV